MCGKKKISFTIFLLFTLSIFISHNLYGSKESFKIRLDNIISKNEAPNKTIGIEVISLNRGDTLYAHNNDKQVNPASCTKLITSLTSLKLLGTSYKFHTKFYTDLRPVTGKVRTMWVKGTGDPSIVIERLWRIARDIANTGLKVIEGDIIIDDYYFSKYKYPGFLTNSTRAYNSLTGAVSLNFNTVTVIVSPSSRIGAPPHVAPDTAGPYFRIINSAKTGARDSKNSISISRVEKNNEDILLIKGNIPVASKPLYIYRNIANPPLYFGLALKSLLEQNGITVKGNIRRGRSPGGGYILLDSVSKPLSLIIRDMNKYSNNFIAEQLTKTLGAEIGTPPGTTEKGIAVFHKFLNHLGIQESEYYLVNGSGLTRKNRLTPSLLTTIIAHLYSDYKIAPEAISSLSIAGKDGTLKDRISSSRLTGIVRAKTGTLSNVSCIAGIIPAYKKEMLGYAVILNGKGFTGSKEHEIEKDILNAMTSFSR